MLIKRKSGGRTLYKSRPLLISAAEAYTPPPPGKAWFQTTTTVWRVDELIRRRVRDWRRLLGEDGHSGSRAETMRKDHDSVYTGTVSVFPAPLVEWILLRYAGNRNGHILDAFTGGPPRSVVARLMGFSYTGFDVRQEQIDENIKALKDLGLEGANFILGDGCLMKEAKGPYDFGFTCPPYHDLEKYSDLPDDISNMGSYSDFIGKIAANACAYYNKLKPGAFLCYVVGPFRDKKTGELIDFPGNTIDCFRIAGFIYWQDIILSKNFGSAAKRSTNAWKGHKLVPIHEHLLVFKKPGGDDGRKDTGGTKRVNKKVGKDS